MSGVLYAGVRACARGGAHNARGRVCTRVCVGARIMCVGVGAGVGAYVRIWGVFGAKNAEIGFLGVEKRVRKTHSLFCHLR